MDPKEILANLSAAIIEGDGDKARKNAQEALGNKVDPLKAVEEGLSRGMAIVGENFEKGEAYLPELLMAADTFSAAMEVLKPEIESQKKQMARAGTVLIGTVKSDVHNIGKNIVATVLETQGFDVVDIGIDNSSLKFIEEAQKVKADVIALSSLMTTTMPGQKEVIDTLKEMKLRDKYFVIAGGGPVTQEWADRIGADGYGKSAVHAAEMVKALMSKRR
jgi:corrinoid protein of di/trimethylamine methyltransferase